MPYGPSQSDLHINAPLTNVSVAYIQDASKYIAHKIFPKVSVQKQTDTFWKYSKSDWRRTDAQKRAPGTESVGGGWNFDTDTYRADVYAVHKDIDAQTRANADSNFNVDADATRFVTNQLMLKRDIDWCNEFFKTGVWAVEKTGVASSPGANQFVQWNDDASDPINDVNQWVLDFIQRTGFEPSVLVLGAQVLLKLKNHPDILDRIKYTQKGIVTEDLLATLFGVPKVITAYATQTSVAQTNDARTQDAAAEAAGYDFIASPKSAALFYVPSGPSLMSPSAGYTFTWNGYSGGNSEGIKVDRFYMKHIKVDRVEGEMTYDMKVVSPDCGTFVNTAVA
jgi:hypothetical protein